MAQAPTANEPVVFLGPGKGKDIAYLVLSLGFVAAGAFLPPVGNRLAAWLGVSFFALCAAVFAVQILPGATYLRLSSEGFTMCTLFRKGPLIPWKDVSNFRVKMLPFPPGEIVALDWNSSSHKVLQRMNKALIGANGGLAETYGLKAQELADLLNDWRSRAVPVE